MIASGLGFLGVAVLLIAAWIWWLRRGRPLMARWVDHEVARRAQVRGIKRFFGGTFTSTALRESARERARAAFTMWLVFVLAAPFFAAVCVLGAVTRFTTES